jgi:hypothetical protein
MALSFKSFWTRSNHTELGTMRGSIAVTLQTVFRKVLGSNLGRDIGDRLVFRASPHSFEANMEIVQ